MGLSLEENGNTYAIAWLTEGSHEFCALDLFIDAEQVTFHVTGKAAIHLTGYFEHDVDDKMEGVSAKAGSAETGKKTEGKIEAKKPEVKKDEKSPAPKKKEEAQKNDTKKPVATPTPEKKGTPQPAKAAPADDDEDDEGEESEEEESEEEAPAPMKSGKDASPKVQEKKTEKVKAAAK